MVQGKLTNTGFTQEILKRFYSPNLIFKNSYEEFQNLYCFIARIEPWDNESIPPTPELTDAYLKSVHKNIIAIKRINSTDISPVIERIDWKANTIFAQYSSNTSMLTLNTQNKLQNKFYIKNSYDQVFKCLSNATTITNPSGSFSTIEPKIDFSFDFSDRYIQTLDGYKWKYMFSIDAGTKLKFYDDNWIPVPVFKHRSDISKSKVGLGEISTINVYNAGTGYTNDESGLDNTSTIIITGDGTGAKASAVISENSVSQILMANTGSGYTFATATIVPKAPFSGNGAIIIPEVSPLGGHGFDLLNELGCRTVMVTSQFNSTEDGTLPGDIDYRQIGLLSNPIISINNKTEFANSFLYRLTTDVVVSPGTGEFIHDEFVFQGTDLQNSYFSGRVLNFNKENNILYLINTSGTITINDLIKGNDSKTLRVASQETFESILPFSGNIDYVENRTKIQRTTSGLEQFRLTINY